MVTPTAPGADCGFEAGGPVDQLVELASVEPHPPAHRAEVDLDALALSDHEQGGCPPGSSWCSTCGHREERQPEPGEPALIGGASAATMRTVATRYPLLQAPLLLWISIELDEVTPAGTTSDDRLGDTSSPYDEWADSRR